MPKPRARRSTRSRSSLSNTPNEPEEENQDLSEPQPVPNDESVVNGKRRRVASAKQGSINDEAIAKQREKLAKLERENAAMKIKLAKAARSNINVGSDDESECDRESEEPVIPENFSSSIRSIGIVSATPKKPLRKRAIGMVPISLPTPPCAVTTDELEGPQPASASKRVNDDSLEGADRAEVGVEVTVSSDDDGFTPRGRKRQRTQSRSPSRRGHPSGSTSPEAMSASARKLLKTAAFRNGMSGGKPRASDYEEVVKRRLLKAMSIYESYIYVTYGYPAQEHQIDWVHKAWGLAGEDAVEKYEMTHHMERLIKDRGPRARGYLKDVTRPHIEKAYGFTPSTSKKAIQKNKDRYLELMAERTFHYKHPEEKTGFAGNPIILKVLREAFFRSKHDRGILHKEAFSPIPLELIALVLTAVEHCIEEWSSGIQVKAKFEESTVLPWYNAHLEKLETWRELNSAVVNNICLTLYKRCSRPTGAAFDKSIPNMTDAIKEAAKLELEGRTGETESESDVSHEA